MSLLFCIHCILSIYIVISRYVSCIDIGDISPFSYFKDFEKVDGKDPISETGEVYSGTLYQNNDDYQTVQIVNPSKDEVSNDEESVPYSQPIFYSQGQYEEYRDPKPPKEDSSPGRYESTPSKTEVEFCHFKAAFGQ